MPDNFFDTNVLVYLASTDERKAAAAHRLVSVGGSISVQVLNEFANVSRRKMKMSWPEVHGFLGLLGDLLEVRPLVKTTHQLGLRIAERYGFSIWDSMIVACALEAECQVLFSEDLQHDMRLEEGLRIVDPFRD